MTALAALAEEIEVLTSTLSIAECQHAHGTVSDEVKSLFKRFLTSGHYVGAPLYRCSRLMATAHGGQVVISRATEEIVADHLPEGAGLRDLGQHRLRDISRTEHVFQLMHADLPSEFPPLKSLEPARTNLAEQLTSFVGRQPELTELRKLLKSSRLITLTGAGGIGKSRIAIQLATLAAESWPDGVWWVELASVGDPSQLPGAVVTALKLPGRGPAEDVVIAWLAAKRALLAQRLRERSSK